MLGLWRNVYLMIIVTKTFEIAYGKPVNSAKLNPDLVSYLTRYGYLPKQQKLPWRVSWDRRVSRRGGNDLNVEQAVRKLQSVMNLPITGQMSDDVTSKIINQKRCGMRDFHTGRRSRRYVLHGTAWKSKNLTYKIANFPSDLELVEVENAIEKALLMWSNASQLTFKTVTLPNVKADINIKFVVGFHGDSRLTDGPGKELAHSFFPDENSAFAGDLHFDNDETFTVNGKGGVDLLWLAVHELGHSLGLEHTFDANSVMFPFYTGYKRDLELNIDDIDGIQYLYGPPQPLTPPPTSTIPTTSPKTLPGICSLSRIDAAVMTKDLKLYAFSGAYFWRLQTQDGPMVLRIRHHWEGLEDDIDAALTRRKDGNTYFFKGSRFWIFRNKALIKGPLNVALLNLPSQLQNMDAAFELSTNGRTYFFKGDKYWRYNWDTKLVDPGYPRTIRFSWRGVPNNIDAVFQWRKGRMTLIKGDQYYSLKRRGRVGVKKGYPKNFFRRWMSCPAGAITNKN